MFESDETSYILTTRKSLLIKKMSKGNVTFFIQNTRYDENRKGKSIPLLSGKDERYISPFVFAKILPATSQSNVTGFELSRRNVIVTSCI